jgi:hypothetical protein
MLKIDAAGGGAIIGVAVAAWVLGLSPAVERRANQTSLRGGVADIAEEARASEGSVRKRDEELKAKRAQLTQMGVQLGPLGQLNQRIQSVGDLATRSGMKLDQIGSGKTEPLGQAVTVPVKLVGTTAYDDARIFMESLRKEFPDMAICGIKLSRGSSPLESEKPVATFELDLVWYALPAVHDGRTAGVAPNSP